MAAKKRVKAPTFTTNRLTFKFPKLNEPDYKFKKEGEFSVKAVGPQSDFQAIIDKLTPMHQQAILDAEVAFKALPVKQRKEFEAKGVKGPVVNPLFGIIYDEATEEPTGDIEFKFSVAAKGEIKNGKYAGTQFVKRPHIFDARGTKIVKGYEFHMLEDGETQDKLLVKAGPPIWGGTVGRITFEVGLNKDDVPGYFIPSSASCGLSLRLQAVQIINLVSGSGEDAAGYGFGEEEGYEGGDYEEPEAEADASDAGNGDF